MWKPFAVKMVQAFLKDLDLQGVVPKSMTGGKR